MKAKAVLVATAWWSTMEAFQVMDRATNPVCPDAIPPSIPLNPFVPAVKKNGWS